MKYDDDRYDGAGDDADLWDDELDLISDDGDGAPRRLADYASDQSSYSPYDAGYGPEEPHGSYGEEDGHQDGPAPAADDEPDDYYSEPVPQTPKKPLRSRLFGRKDDGEDDDEGNDYYDSAEDQQAERKPAPQPKAPRLDPEDPDYWISDDDSPLGGMISGKGKGWMWKTAGVLLLVLMVVFGWIWYFRPYSDNAVKYGYISHMERRGSLIKTFEGTLIPYKELGDPNPLYFEKVGFSVQGDSLAAVMKRMMLGSIPVRVEYETYHAPLPWKGEHRMIIVRADTADPGKIFPPEFRH